VLKNVTPDMPIFTQEIFGPVAPIVTFKTEQEAIELANATELGLSASIHTANSAKGEYMAGLIEAGMVHVNDQTVNNEYHIPFGGLKDSGDAGRIGGPVNLEEFTHSKWISVMPQGIQYPF
jgi:benzaldehyde dehydrogenase (NAD)